MVDLNNIQSVYFIGVGGIGMSALARYFNNRGVTVSGYDRNATPLTQQLEDEGIQMIWDEAVTAAPKDIDVVVYTPAIPVTQPQLAYYLSNGYNVKKRSDVLEAISSGTYNICVAGTHGKTTISTMVAHVLRHTGYGCSAFLGGISANYNTNFWSNSNNTSVIEADEFDRSFLKLHPDVAVIAAMDADHLDIYGTAGEVEAAFLQFAEKIKPGGLLIKKHELVKTDEFKNKQQWSYSLNNKNATVFAANVQPVGGGYVFDADIAGTRFVGVQLNMGGLHNVENMLAAMAVAVYLKIDIAKIQEAVAAFKGVKRRFEYIVNNESVIYIDDYAHHPEELSVLINGAKHLFGNRKCTLLFQPHLYSRTRDFATGFSEKLGLADEVLLLPVYPAREQPIEGVDSTMIGKNIQKPVQYFDKTDALQYIKKNVANNIKPQLLITAGAGDIDKLVNEIKKIITE